MALAELVPEWEGMPSPSGPEIPGFSMRGRNYRRRGDHTELALASIAATRGISDVEGFLNPSLADLPDPYGLVDMNLAAFRLREAIRKDEKVLVFGDYDVDGASATSLLLRFARQIGRSFDHFIPDRMEHGYGPSEAAFEACSPSDYDLVIFVDCGTGSGDLLADLGCDVIVIDHHKVQGGHPEVVAFVNPHRADDDSGLGMLCAASLTFLVVVAVRRALRAVDWFKAGDEPDLRELLDVAALATICDVVPLVGTSRLIVHAGLQQMAKEPSPGVAALMKVAGVTEPTAGRIGFSLGPRINAAGRIGGGSTSPEGALGVRLLSASSPDEAVGIAEQLHELNAERQAVEKVALAEAINEAAEQVEAGRKVICLFSQEWHPGVVGIVAARVRERFDRPAIIGGSDGERIKASGRSVPGFDLGALVIEARSRGLLEAGGGHAVACGLTCAEDDWAAFLDFVEANAKWNGQPLVIDCLATARRIKLADVEDLDRLQPLGQGNPAPICLLDDVFVRDARPFGRGHVRLTTDRRDLEIVFWRAEEDGLADQLLMLRAETIRVVGQAKINEWNGFRKISFEATDILYR